MTQSSSFALDKMDKIQIDFPLSGEKIGSSHYAFRMATNMEGSVEVSVDDTDWQPCRRAVGYWWFDFENLQTGEHALVARVRKPNGGVFYTMVRHFETYVKASRQDLKHVKASRKSVSGNGRRAVGVKRILVGSQ